MTPGDQATADAEGKTQPGRQRRVFKGQSKKMSHGTSKQQAAGILSGGGNLARILERNPGGSPHMGSLRASHEIPVTDWASW